MTGPLSPGASASAQLQAVGAAAGPIDWYWVTLINFQPDVEVPWQGSSQPFVFHLSHIAPALAQTVAAANQHIDSWIEDSATFPPSPGVRDVLQSSLFKPFVATGQSVASTASKLQQLLDEIPSSGATADQIAQASADFAELRAIVDQAAAQVASAQSTFAGFSHTILADVAAMQTGAGSIQAAIAGFGAWFEYELEHMQSSGLTIGADLKLLQDYAAAYHKSLDTLQSEMQQGINAAGPAASALEQVAEQWSTLQQTTSNVARQLIAASKQSLASDLTALELATAVQEWATVQELATSFLTTMQAVPIPRSEGQ